MYYVDYSLGDSLPFLIIRYVIIIIYFIINIILLTFIFKRKIASRTATILMKAETVCDLVLLLCLVLTVFKEEKIFHSRSFAYVRFYCYLILGNPLYWMMLFISIYLMVALSIDRFICIVFPLYYRRRSYYSVYFYLLVAILCGSIFGSVNYFLRKIKTIQFNSTEGLDILYSCPQPKSVASATFYLITYSAGPIVTILTLNIISIRCLLGSLRNKENMKSSSFTFTRRTMVTRFTIATFIANSSYSIILMWDVLFYILDTAQLTLIIQNYYAYYSQYICCCLTVVNPLVYLILFKNFRQYISSLFKLELKLKKC